MSSIANQTRSLMWEYLQAFAGGVHGYRTLDWTITSMTRQVCTPQKTKKSFPDCQRCLKSSASIMMRFFFGAAYLPNSPVFVCVGYRGTFFACGPAMMHERVLQLRGMDDFDELWEENRLLGPMYYMAWTIIGAFIFVSLFVVVLLEEVGDISKQFNMEAIVKVVAVSCVRECVYACCVCVCMCVHGAGGAPRQAQVLSAGRGTGMKDRNGQEYISVVRNTFLSTGVRGNARSPARKQHLGLPGGAAGAMDACTCVRTHVRACVRM